VKKEVVAVLLSMMRMKRKEKQEKKVEERGREYKY
jgi:hypothetical protein